MSYVRISAALAFFMSMSLPALADPLIQPGGKPGAAKSWSSKGNVVTLQLAEGFSAEDAAAAISKSVSGASAKADGTTVVVSGVEEAKLLAALEKVEVASGLDDVNSMFATLQAGNAEDGSGSSIRATKQASMVEVVQDPAVRVPATVLEVKHGTYPFVAVTVKIDQVPKGVQSLKKGAKATVVPRINAPKGVIARDDEQSKMNVGAWYVKKGDKVMLKLEGKTEQGFWVADRFERLR